MIFKKIISSSLVLGLFFSGCATLNLETKVKMTNSIWLKPTVAEKKSVYIQFKNTSGEDFNLVPAIKENLLKKGYIVVENPNKAKYVLMVNILFANNLKEANAIKVAGNTGAVTAIIASGSGSSTRDSLLVGATFALASGLASSALEDETYRAVVDVVIDEKTDDTDEKGIMGDGYKEQKTRIFAEAVRADLKLKEALPVLQKKIATQIANIF